MEWNSFCKNVILDGVVARCGKVNLKYDIRVIQR